MPKRKILFYTEAWGIGGIESFVMNTVETLDRNRFDFDIFSTHDWSDSYDARIRELGGHRSVVFHGQKPNLVKRLIYSTRAWAYLLKNNHYDAVHINTMNGVGFVYSAIAKKYKVQIRIVHSHNSAFLGGRLKDIAHKCGRTLFGNTATDRLACSQQSGEYLFADKPFEILQNGIDTSRFRFNQESREEIRRQLDVPNDALLFGSIGRLAEAKNPTFQIDILNALRSSGIPAYLVLVGEGPLRSSLESYAVAKHLNAYCLMPGNTSKPEQYLSALDVFTMPSLFEGAPFALLEAFTNGLPIVLSNQIQGIQIEEGTERYLSLNDASEWGRCIKNLWKNGKENRWCDSSSSMQRQISKFDRKNTTLHLERIYARSFLCQ